MIKVSLYGVMIILSVFTAINNNKNSWENRAKINITPYGETFDKLNYWDKI